MENVSLTVLKMGDLYLKHQHEGPNPGDKEDYGHTTCEEEPVAIAGSDSMSDGGYHNLCSGTSFTNLERCE